MATNVDLLLSEQARRQLERRARDKRLADESLARLLDTPDGLAFVAGQLAELNFMRPLAATEADAFRHNMGLNLFRRCAKVRGAAAMRLMQGIIEEWD